MVMFTSPGDGDGKTDLLMALAPELAKHTTGSVLVVDANFRKPDLTSRLSLPAGQQPHRPTSDLSDQSAAIERSAGAGGQPADCGRL